MLLVLCSSRYPDSPPDSSSEPYSPPNGSTTTSLNDPRNTAGSKTHSICYREPLGSVEMIDELTNRQIRLQSLGPAECPLLSGDI